MRSKAIVAARVLLGLVFFVFGLNGFLHFLPMHPMSGAAGQFMGGLAASGYLLPLLFGTQTLAGLALLIGRFVPLALAVLAPVITNIVAFHVWLAPSGLVVALFVAALELFLAWSYRDAFRSMLRARVEAVAPVSGEAAPARRAHAQ